MNLGIDALKRLMGSVSKFTPHGEVSMATLSAVKSTKFWYIQVAKKIHRDQLIRQATSPLWPPCSLHKLKEKAAGHISMALLCLNFGHIPCSPLYHTTCWHELSLMKELSPQILNATICCGEQMMTFSPDIKNTVTHTQYVLWQFCTLIIVFVFK